MSRKSHIGARHVVATIAVGALVAAVWALTISERQDRRDRGSSEVVVDVPDPSAAQPGPSPDPAPADPSPSGRWHEAQSLHDGVHGSSDEIAAQLHALGYLSGYEPDPGRSGVTIHDAEAVSPGFNLYVSGHAPEAVLADMAGRVLHRWSMTYRDAFPDGAGPVRPEDSADYWRRAHVFENGDLLAIFEGLGLIRLDRDSRLRWARGPGFHHDLWVGDDETVYALVREERMRPDVRAGGPVLDDFIVVLDRHGEVQSRVSVLDALTSSPFAHLLSRIPDRSNILHTNTVELLDGSLAGSIPAFEAGNVLISILFLDALAVVDMEAEQVVWAQTGFWAKQHQPTVLPNGNLLLFDNLGQPGRSRVVEFDPRGPDIRWTYEGREDEPFLSRTCGSAQRLPDGNTLITESDSGRAFEVNREGRVVWELYNPARAGAHRELIATLFEVVRLPSDFPVQWAAER